MHNLINNPHQNYQLAYPMALQPIHVGVSVWGKFLSEIMDTNYLVVWELSTVKASTHSRNGLIVTKIALTPTLPPLQTA